MEKYGKEKQHLGLESQRDRLTGEAEREGDRATAKQRGEAQTSCREKPLVAKNEIQASGKEGA